MIYDILHIIYYAQSARPPSVAPPQQSIGPTADLLRCSPSRLPSDLSLHKVSTNEVKPRTNYLSDGDREQLKLNQSGGVSPFVCLIYVQKQVPAGAAQQSIAIYKYIAEIINSRISCKRSNPIYIPTLSLYIYIDIDFQQRFVNSQSI